MLEGLKRVSDRSSAQSSSYGFSSKRELSKIEELPYEILMKILLHLPIVELISMSSVSNHFHGPINKIMKGVLSVPDCLKVKSIADVIDPKSKDDKASLAQAFLAQNIEKIFLKVKSVGDMCKIKDSLGKIIKKCPNLTSIEIDYTWIRPLRSTPGRLLCGVGNESNYLIDLDPLKALIGFIKEAKLNVDVIKLNYLKGARSDDRSSINYKKASCSISINNKNEQLLQDLVYEQKLVFPINDEGMIKVDRYKNINVVVAWVGSIINLLPRLYAYDGIKHFFGKNEVDTWREEDLDYFLVKPITLLCLAVYCYRQYKAHRYIAPAIKHISTSCFLEEACIEGTEEIETGTP